MSSRRVISEPSNAQMLHRSTYQRRKTKTSWRYMLPLTTAGYTIKLELRATPAGRMTTNIPRATLEVGIGFERQGPKIFYSGVIWRKTAAVRGRRCVCISRGRSGQCFSARCNMNAVTGRAAKQLLKRSSVLQIAKVSS